VSNTHPDPGPPAPARPRASPPSSTRDLPIAIRAVARPGGGTRRIALLSAVDARAYEAAVARTVSLVERAMGPEVFADRATVRASRLELHDWRAARDRLQRTASQLLRRSAAAAVLITDVRDCFASIGPGHVRTALERLGADEEAVVQIADQLRSFADRGVTGLPVGPAASAVLANAVLHELDRSLRGTGLPYTRWVDDVMVFAPDRSTAERASTEVRRTLERIGLEANEGKTWILGDRPEACRLLGTSLSPTGGVGRVP
jgi:hypothetical protein